MQGRQGTDLWHTNYQMEQHLVRQTTHYLTRVEMRAIGMKLTVAIDMSWKTTTGAEILLKMKFYPLK